MDPLAQLFDETAGAPLPLPPELLALYGPLRLVRSAVGPLVEQPGLAEAHLARRGGRAADLAGQRAEERDRDGESRRAGAGAVGGRTTRESSHGSAGRENARAAYISGEM